MLCRALTALPGRKSQVAAAQPQEKAEGGGGTILGSVGLRKGFLGDPGLEMSPEKEWERAENSSLFLKQG